MSANGKADLEIQPDYFGIVSKGAIILRSTKLS